MSASSTTHGSKPYSTQTSKSLRTKNSHLVRIGPGNIFPSAVRHDALTRLEADLVRDAERSADQSYGALRVFGWDPEEVSTSSRTELVEKIKFSDAFKKVDDVEHEIGAGVDAGGTSLAELALFGMRGGVRAEEEARMMERGSEGLSIVREFRDGFTKIE